MQLLAAVCGCVFSILSALLVLPIEISAAEKVTGKLYVQDALTVPGRPVKLEARLVRENLLAHTGLGGEQIEFLVGGKKIGKAMTGGDGHAFLEYTPRMRGNLVLTARLTESPRVASVEDAGTLFSWERRRPILLVEMTALTGEASAPVMPLPPLSSGKTFPISPAPIPDAAGELKRLTDFYFNVMYVGTRAVTDDSDDMRQWLRKHGFPPGPVIAIRAGEGPLSEMIEGLRTDGWDNVKAGIGRTKEFADVLVAQRLDVVIVPEPERGQLPRKAQVAKSWKDVRKKRL